MNQLHRLRGNGKPKYGQFFRFIPAAPRSWRTFKICQKAMDPEAWDVDDHDGGPTSPEPLGVVTSDLLRSLTLNLGNESCCKYGEWALAWAIGTGIKYQSSHPFTSFCS